MRPDGLKTKVFLDSGDPNETKQALELLGFLDGQTTNPSLFAKNPDVKARIDAGEKFTKEEIYDAYKGIVQEIRSVLQEGSISIEVYADSKTSRDEMVDWGREMHTWIDGAHIKLPTIEAGLDAAEQLTIDGINVNMTLVFSEEQAAAVYAATKHRKAGTSTYLSPFIGRLDDIGQNGVDLIANTLHTYRDEHNEHVEVLAASIRSLEHLMAMFAVECDIVTVPFKILEEWVAAGMTLPGENFVYNATKLEHMPYQDLQLDGHWRDYNIHHDLTDKGLEKFAADWNALLA